MDSRHLRLILSHALYVCSASLLFLTPVFSQTVADGSNRLIAVHPEHGFTSGRSLDVQYTGALFGYYRVEANRGPIVGGATKTLPAVKKFLDDRQGDHGLLLGMGDNFAPEFGASIQLEGVGPDCEKPALQFETNKYGRDQAPALLYKLSGWVAPHAHCDNVTNFLLKAGYRAVVPGREDFLYSAGWLQSIGILLKHEQAAYNPNPEHRLNLLAANLRVEGGKTKACPLLFSQDAVKATEDKRPDEADAEEKTQCSQSEGELVPEAVDWIERLDVAIESERVNEEMRVAAHGSPYVRRQLLINQMSMTLVAMRDAISKVNDQRQKSDLVNTIKNLKRLTTEDGYRIEDGKVVPHESLLSSVDDLEEPFSSFPKDVQTAVEGLEEIFDQLKSAKTDKAEVQQAEEFLFEDGSRRAVRHLLLRSVAAEERDNGYVFSDFKIGDKVSARTLLVGVVGRETMNAVSPTNLQLGAGKVTVLDPRRSAEILVRAAYLAASDEHQPISKVIIMAQMPHTEAEELGAHLRADLLLPARFFDGPFPIDLILSEAQAEHASPILDTRYHNDEMIPVLTPHPAFSRTLPGLVAPVSVAQIREVGSARHMSNRTSLNSMPNDGLTTTLKLLRHELADSGINATLDDTSAIDFLLREIQASSHADVVLLERRDLYLGPLPLEYSDYEDICLSPKTLQQATQTPVLEKKSADEKACRLHVALDRILWKGDFSQRVMVTGKDLKDALKAADDQVIAQRSLAARDTSDQWLVTFGVVTSDSTNLTRLESSSDRFGVPWSDECRVDEGQKDTQYCVNGATIADDAGYWISTSDHIANDTEIYTMFEPKMADYRQQQSIKLVYTHPPSRDRKAISEDVFLTDELTANLRRQSANERNTLIVEASQRTPQGTVLQHLQQTRSLIHWDYAKLVAGFSLRHPDGGNAAAAGFQGVTDTRASQPSQQELDLESLSRFSSDVKTANSAYAFSVGSQSDAEYDRAILGNLINKPINASYTLNSLTAGGFIEKRFPFWRDAKTTDGSWASRQLPRTLFVLYPYQYQRQITGNFIFLNYSAGNGELTIQAPVVSGHSYKAGLRHEFASGRKRVFDSGSYVESGWEYVVQNDVARSLTLTTASTHQSKVCYATQTQTISECFSGFTINSTTMAGPPDLVSQTTTGMYWDIHVQRSLPKGGDSTNAKINVAIDTKGDFFGERRSSLATQTRYAFPVSASINFPVLRNLSLSPTYSAFLFENQLSQQSILVNTFSMSAKWYYDRDSAVPFGRMFLFKGPASQDQTKTAKTK